MEMVSSLPQLSDDAETPFTVVVIPVNDKWQSQLTVVSENQGREYRHQTRSATAVGIRNTTKKNGISSFTEYPALETPSHMLIPAPTNQSPMKINADLASSAGWPLPA
jgi:hypothetical protein